MVYNIFHTFMHKIIVTVLAIAIVVVGALVLLESLR